MPSDFGAELVQCDVFTSLKKLEILSWNNKVVILFHVTDGAVTFVNANLFGSLKAETYCPAVTATLHRNFHSQL